MDRDGWRAALFDLTNKMEEPLREAALILPHAGALLGGGAPGPAGGGGQRPQPRRAPLAPSPAVRRSPSPPPCAGEDRKLREVGRWRLVGAE
jgi:hypothetical protein